jgi:hypothetical protein
MTRSDRVFVRDVLIRAGYAEDWVSAKSGPISRTYYYDRRSGPPAPKDDKGMAIYGPEDVAGLLEVARDLKDGNGGRLERPAPPTCGNTKCSMWSQQHGGPCDD